MKLVKTILTLFFFTTKIALAQNTEQKALTFLAANIYGHELKNSEGNFIVTKDSTQIWYKAQVSGSKNKVNLENAVKSSLEHFNKVLHSNKDIFITTKAAIISKDKKLTVPFELYTKYGNTVQVVVIFENGEPINLVNETLRN